MALIRCDVNSKILDMDTSLSVILPQDKTESAERPKVLYLLHGLCGSCVSWVLRTRIYDLAIKYNLAVVMPEVQRSFYCDMKYGCKYYSYIVDELPEICADFFRLSTEREDNYIAGLSMGGYGALKLGLLRPCQYAGCAGFSGCTDIKSVVRDGIDDNTISKDITAIFGESHIVHERDDLFSLVQKLAGNKEGIVPKIFMTCGKSDFLHDQNIRFKEHLERFSFQFEYKEWEGIHNWDFWSSSIELACKYFFEEEETL